MTCWLKRLALAAVALTIGGASASAQTGANASGIWEDPSIWTLGYVPAPTISSILAAHIHRDRPRAQR